MIEPAALLIFMTATFILLITPGPAVLFIIARSLEQGRWAGIVSAVGVGAGSIIHVIVAAAGLSMLLVQSALAYSVVTYLGAIFVLMAILSDSVYALVAGSVRGWLAGNRRWAEFQRKFAGTVYIGLGITTALTGRKG